MRTAFIAIDFINDIVHLKGKIPSCAAQVAERNAVQQANLALQYARTHDWLPIFVKVGFSSSYKEQPKNSPIFGKAHTIGALQLGEWGTEFVDTLAVDKEDLVVIKPRVNPFHGTILDSALRANGIEQLAICGVSTTWAIQSIVRDAHDRDYKSLIIEDACAAASQEEHMLSITQLSRIATIVTVDNLS